MRLFGICRLLSALFAGTRTLGHHVLLPAISNEIRLPDVIHKRSADDPVCGRAFVKASVGTANITLRQAAKCFALGGNIGSLNITFQSYSIDDERTSCAFYRLVFASLLYTEWTNGQTRTKNDCTKHKNILEEAKGKKNRTAFSGPGSQWYNCMDIGS